MMFGSAWNWFWAYLVLFGLVCGCLASVDSHQVWNWVSVLVDYGMSFRSGLAGFRRAWTAIEHVGLDVQVRN